MTNKIIGITLDTKSTRSKDRIYYYKTNKDFKNGETITIKGPTGGKPTATVVDTSGLKKFSGSIKELEVTK